MCFLLSGDVKEFGSTLEVRGRKERTQSLSNVDILISPCDNNHSPPHTSPASPQSDETNANVEKPAEKTRLEAAVSFPLERSKVTQYLFSPNLSGSLSSNRKSVSSIVYSPAHQDREVETPPGPRVTVEKNGGDETKQEVEERTSGLSDREQGGETVDSNHGNKGGEELSEELLVEEDRMYPTLRSKSLNANPRKTKRKENEETPRPAGSVADLVSAFRGSTGGQVQDQVQRL